MKFIHKFIIIFVFSAAMAYIESSTVIYLRMLFYPEGFQFPLKLIPQNIILIEIAREISTIVMLCIVSIIFGKFLAEKFFYFIYAFGVWDIFYYLWLKLLLNWPQSLFTDDLLFLIPVPWIAPVLAPIIISVEMILFSVISIHLQSRGYFLKSNKLSNVITVIGVALILYTFMWDFSNRTLSKSPVEFLWEFFIVGELLILSGFIIFLKRLKK